MGVIAVLRSLHLNTRRDHRSVDIDVQGAQLQPRQYLRNHGGIERHQMLDFLHREAPQPAARRSRRRPRLNPSETVQQRVAGEVLQVLEAASTHHQQPDQHPHHRNDAEVTAEMRLSKGAPGPIVEPCLAQVSIEQLQSGVRSELHFAKLETKIPIDTSMQFGCSSSHSLWPFVCARKLVRNLLSTTTKGLF
jgi:hypothetical protein